MGTKLYMLGFGGLIINIGLIVVMLASMPYQEQQSVANIRLLVLLVSLSIFLLALLLSIKLQGPYQHNALACGVCLVVTVAMTNCQVLIDLLSHQYKTRESEHAMGKSQFLEQFCTVEYYMVYAGTSIGFLLATYYMVTNKLSTARSQRRNISAFLEQGRPSQEGECAICLEAMESVQVLYVEVKVCGHVFHRDCMLKWLQHKNSCPLCRENIFRTNKRLHKIDPSNSQ